MGLFAKLFKKEPVNESKLTLADYLNSFPPIYSSKQVKAIENDVFRAGCAFICREMRKVKVGHVRMVDNDPVPQADNINFILNNPNPLMTLSDFLEKLTWIYLTKENCFVYPVYDDQGKLSGLYPLEPTTYKFVEFKDNPDLFVQMWFGNGKERYSVKIPYQALIHLRRNFTRNEFAGGDETGQFDSTTLDEAIKLDKEVTAGLKKQIKTSYASNIILKLQSTYNQEKEEAAQKVFEAKLANSESGVLAVGIDSEVETINRNINFISTDLIKYLEEKILRPLGISVAAIKGDYNKEQYEAVFQSAIEPILTTFAQAFTKGIFTRTQLGYGHKIQFYAEELIFLNMTQKIELIRVLGDSGSLYINEARTMVGLRPMAELAGQRMMSLNYINAQNAAKYQVGEKEEEKPKEEKPEGGEVDEQGNNQKNKGN